MNAGGIGATCRRPNDIGAASQGEAARAAAAIRAKIAQASRSASFMTDPQKWKTCVAMVSLLRGRVEGHVRSHSLIGERAMIELRPFAELGAADHGWLKARHHFSFAGYHDRSRMGWGRAARVERRRDRRGRGLSGTPACRHGNHHLCPRRRDYPSGFDGQRRPHRGRRRAGDVGGRRCAPFRVQSRG